MNYLFLTTWAALAGLFLYLGEPFWASVFFGLVLALIVWVVLIVFIAALIVVLETLATMGVVRLPR